MTAYSHCDLPTEYTTELIEYLCQHEILQNNPVVLIDVGCSGGIHNIWRVFSNDTLIAHGFDPIKSEVDKLNRAENYNNVNYHHYYIGLNDDHPLKQTNSRYTEFAGIIDIQETSGIAAIRNSTKNDHTPRNIKLGSMNNPSAERITLDGFLRDNNIHEVDYLKSDTDGFDIEVLHSATELINTGELLCICIETSMSGIGGKLHNGFGNIHVFLQNAGYTFFGLCSPANYSLSELPDIFEYNIFARTMRGMTLCTNAIYMQDYIHSPKNTITDKALIKLLCFYVLQGYHDWAAKTIIKYKERLLQLDLDPELLLNLLVPRLFGKKLTYKEYIALFTENPELFLPENREALQAKVGLDLT